MQKPVGLEADTQQSQSKRQLLWPGLVGAVVGLSIGVLNGVGADNTLVLLGTGGVLAIWWVVGKRGLRQQDWLAPPVLFAVAAAFYYVVRPVSLVLGMPPIGQSTTLHIKMVMALILLTIGGFAWGYTSRAAQLIACCLARATRGWDRQGEVFCSRRMALATSMLWLAGTVCWSVLMLRSGGVSGRLAGYGLGGAAGLGVWVVLSSALLALALVLGWLEYLNGRLSLVAMGVLAATTVPMLALHGQRSAVLVPLVMAVTIYHYHRRRLNLKSLVLITTAVTVLFVGLGLCRLQRAPGVTIHVGTAAYTRLVGWFFLRNLTAFDALLLAVEGIPERLDYQWGRGYLDSLVMLVPRRWYADKPQRNLFNRTLRPGRLTSMSLPPPGEGYLNFGWGGVLLGGALWGLLYGAAYAYRQRCPAHEGVLLTYAFLLAFFVIIFRGGLLGGHLGLLAVYLVLIGAISVFCAQGRDLVSRA